MDSPARITYINVLWELIILIKIGVIIIQVGQGSFIVFQKHGNSSSQIGNIIKMNQIQAILFLTELETAEPQEATAAKESKRPGLFSKVEPHVELKI